MNKIRQNTQTPQMVRSEYELRAAAWKLIMDSGQTLHSYFRIRGSDSGSCFNR